MATIIYAEGWEHRSLALDDFNAADGEGIADFIAAAANCTIVQTNPRSGASCLRVAPAGASTGPEKLIPGTDPAISVVGLGIRFETSLPAASSQLFIFNAAAGGDGRLEYNSATSKFRLQIVGGGASDIGPTLAADTWYWVDLRYDVSGGTRTLDGAIDEGANTQVTLVVAASTITFWKFGTDSTHTYTARYDDFVASNTSADYPLGKKKVLPLHVNGDGTHVISGAGDFDKADGTDILVSTTDAWTEIDDWITGADDGATTAIIDLVGASTEYTEHTFDNTAGEATIDAVMGTMASPVVSATAHTATFRIVDSAGATIKDLFSGDVSISIATHYRHVLVSQNPSSSTVDGYKFRFGFSTDVAPDPKVTAVMLTYVIPEPAGDPNATVTPSTIAAVGAVPAPTTKGAAASTPATVAGTSSVPAATLLAGAIVLASAVAAAVSVPTPTIIAESPDALVTPATVAASGAVPAPTVQGAAQPIPGAVAAVGAVPAPTIRGAAIVAPPTVAATVSVPTPAVLVGGDATVIASTVVALVAVAAPTTQGAARPTPSTVAANAALSGPVVIGTAITVPATVAVLAAIPAVIFGEQIIVYLSEGDSASSGMDSDFAMSGLDADSSVTDFGS